MSEAREEIRNQGRSQEQAEDYESMPGPGFLRKLPPEEKLGIEEALGGTPVRRGKCRSCSRPVCRESVDLCGKHLAMKREAQRRRKGTVYAHGRHPNTIKALKEASEKRKKTE